MQGLLDKLVYINTTIMELPAAMQSAYTNLASAKANLVRCCGCVSAGAVFLVALVQQAKGVMRCVLFSVAMLVHIGLFRLTCLQDATMSGSPSPGSVATDLTTFINNMPSLTPLDNLITSLQQAETVVYAAGNGFPEANTATLLVWLGQVR